MLYSSWTCLQSPRSSLNFSVKCKHWKSNNLQSRKWKRGAKIITSLFPCWRETHTEKNKSYIPQKIHMTIDAWCMIIDAWRSVFTMILREAMHSSKCWVENLLEKKTMCPILYNNLRVYLFLIVSRLFFACCRHVQVIVGCVLFVVGHFRSFLARCRSFQIVSCSL